MRRKILCGIALVSISPAHANIQKKLIVNREKINIIKNNIKSNQSNIARDCKSDCRSRPCRYKCKM